MTGIAVSFVITMGLTGCGGSGGTPPVGRLTRDQTKVTTAFLHAIRASIGARFRFTPEQDFCFPDRAVGGFRCQYVDIHETSQPHVAPELQSRSAQVRSTRTSTITTETSTLSSIAATYEVKIASGRWRGTLELLNPSPVRDFADTASAFPATLSGTY